MKRSGANQETIRRSVCRASCQQDQSKPHNQNSVRSDRASRKKRSRTSKRLKICMRSCWIVGLVVAATLGRGAAEHLRHAVRQHRKLRSDRSVDATYLVQFLGIDSMRRFHATYGEQRRHDVHVTAWYPQFQAAAVAQVSEDVLWELLNDPSVAYMEADEWVYGSSAVPPEALQLPNHTVHAPKAATTPAYYTGAGVRVYVLDSGIQSNHDEFSATTVQCHTAGSCEDPWGHGTHVAALIAGRTFGVAPDVELIAMPVLGADTKARFSQVLAALDHVVVAEQQSLRGTRAIVNLSLGTPRVATILNEAVQRTVEAGIPVIVAAGNGATDACNWSPASAMGSIAVGALDRNGIRYKASNYGPCVDLYAPGELITSAWKDNTLNTITGTSSASPFITGIAALYLELDPSLTPAELLDLLLHEDHHAMTVIPDALLSQPADTTSTVSSNNSTTAITDFILDEDVLAAARTFIANASTVSSDAPTVAPTVTPVDWFEQIRETVQLRFWNNGGE